MKDNDNAGLALSATFVELKRQAHVSAQGSSRRAWKHDILVDQHIEPVSWANFQRWLNIEIS